MKKTILFLMLSTALYAQENKEININIAKSGKFDILYHRAQSTATGAILFGLVGAGIQEGVLSNKDTKMEKQILTLLSDSSCEFRLIDSLIKKLNKNNFNTYIRNNNETKSKELSLDIKINKCGFKMVNTTTKDVSAFVDFRVSLKQGKTVIYKNKFTIKSKYHYVYSDLVKDKQKTNDEFLSVLERAGVRLANKIIYL